MMDLLGFGLQGREDCHGARLWRTLRNNSKVSMSTYSYYRKNMVQRFWKYQNANFYDWEEYFERPFNPDGRPPVFHKKAADNNVIFNPDGVGCLK